MIYTLCITLSVLFVLLACGFIHEQLGLRPNYVVTNTQAGRLFVSFGVVWLVSFCPSGQALAGEALTAYMAIGTVAMWWILNMAIGKAAYRVESPRQLVANPPRGYQRLNMGVVHA